MSPVQQNLCVLFGDVSGSTRLYEKLGDAEALRAVERCLNRMDRVAAAHGGRVVKTIGDEIMVVFDDTASCMRAACDMQQRVDDLPPVSGVKMAIRVGFHFGATLVENKDVFGDTVNMAARMTGLAKAGQIVTSEETVLRLPPDMRKATRDIDALTVKGKSDNVRVFEVIWQENAELTMKAVFIPTLTNIALLKLRHGSDELVLGPARPAVALGRDSGCDVVIRDPRASRTHGRIEMRRDKFVFVDQSTNGTYVTFQGEAEFVLKREEVFLRGRGRIVFGHAWSPDVTETVEFVAED
jgi:class 3 adenylate cyclase